jgi:hypothetical protein
MPPKTGTSKVNSKSVPIDRSAKTKAAATEKKTAWVPFKYKTVRVAPCEGGLNSVSATNSTKGKVVSLEQYIEIESETMRDMLIRTMRCDVTLSNLAVKAFVTAARSFPTPSSSSSSTSV